MLCFTYSQYKKLQTDMRCLPKAGKFIYLFVEQLITLHPLRMVLPPLHVVFVLGDFDLFYYLPPYLWISDHREKMQKFWLIVIQIRLN